MRNYLEFIYDQAIPSLIGSQGNVSPIPSFGYAPESNVGTGFLRQDRAPFGFGYVH